jgi:hypothetical protein
LAPAKTRSPAKQKSSAGLTKAMPSTPSKTTLPSAPLRFPLTTRMLSPTRYALSLGMVNERTVEGALAALPNMCRQVVAHPCQRHPHGLRHPSRIRHLPDCRLRNHSRPRDVVVASALATLRRFAPSCLNSSRPPTSVTRIASDTPQESDTCKTADFETTHYPEASPSRPHLQLQGSLPHRLLPPTALRAPHTRWRTSRLHLQPRCDPCAVTPRHRCRVRTCNPEAVRPVVHHTRDGAVSNDQDFGEGYACGVPAARPALRPQGVDPGVAVASAPPPCRSPHTRWRCRQ